MNVSEIVPSQSCSTWKETRKDGRKDEAEEASFSGRHRSTYPGTAFKFVTMNCQKETPHARKSQKWNIRSKEEK